MNGVTRHAGHCWRSKDELISDVLLWTPTYGCAKAGRPARTYIQQLCEDTGCNPEDLPEAMNDREKWRERVRDIRAGGATWWWWWNMISDRPTSIMVRVFGNGPEYWGSIPGWIILKTKKKWYFMPPYFQHYKVRFKGKVEQSYGVAPSPIPWCSSYRKGSLRVTLDYGR